MQKNILMPASEKPKIVTREEWLSARLELLEEEKELTHKSDELARKRQRLPWVKVDKEYLFEADNANVSLNGLFNGRSQLLIYHFMFGPEYKAGCPSCSAIADEFNGIWTHLINHDVSFWAISRAPFFKLKEYKERMKWNFPWASSFKNQFNYDFNVSFTEDQQQHGTVEYNYNKGNVSSRDNDIKKYNSAPSPTAAKIAEGVGTDWNVYTREAPGMSAFILHEGEIFHTYSTYARGLDVLWGMFQWLDRAPLGRNENGYWLKRHDEYKNSPSDEGSEKSCCCNQ